MRQDSKLTAEQRSAIIVTFEAGFGPKATARQLGLRRHRVRTIYDRWRIHGRDALVPKSKTHRYDFATKLDVVQRFLAGEPKTDLAQEFGLASPRTVGRWVQEYKEQGEDGLRPRQRGRPPGSRRNETDFQRLERENLYLRAEVEYLKKLKALRDQKQR